MEALAAFAGKLADRYRPGGTLAQSQGWGERYGVRAWELDNEPEGYFTCWKGQAADYAEFVTRASCRIRASDPQAVIVAPAMGSGKQGLQWLSEALDSSLSTGSTVFRQNGKAYSLGPQVNVVSFHNYEGLDSALTGQPRTIGQVFDDAPLQGGGHGYGDKHRQQLIAIRILQAQGLPLNRIRNLLYGRSLEDLLRIEKEGLSELQKSSSATFRPTLSESWTVTPLNDEFLLVSRRGRGMSPELRESLLALLCGETNDLKSRNTPKNYDESTC
jgi:hypothetical protein